MNACNTKNFGIAMFRTLYNCGIVSLVSSLSRFREPTVLTRVCWIPFKDSKRRIRLLICYITFLGSFFHLFRYLSGSIFVEYTGYDVVFADIVVINAVCDGLCGSLFHLLINFFCSCIQSTAEETRKGK